jgi:hypothetical protein
LQSNENLKSLVPTHDSSLIIEIPYPFGKHLIKVTKFQGQVLFDPEKNCLSSGTITLNVEDFMTKDQTLLCHFLEAMSLDYSVSDYPKKHVGIGNKLPSVGKNSPRFKTISATLLGPSPFSEKNFKIKWLIRGIERDLDVPVKISWSTDKKRLNLSAEWKMSRSDFDIVVKKFLFIDADNTLALKLHLVLETNLPSVG